MLVHVVTHPEHPDIDPFVFMNVIDAREFANARWPEDEVSITPLTLIDHYLALQMISEELDERADDVDPWVDPNMHGAPGIG